MRDLPILLIPHTRLSRLTLTTDFNAYSEHLQRVIVYILTHKFFNSDTASSYSGWDIVRNYTSGSLNLLLNKLDNIATEMLRQEVSENLSYIRDIDINGEVLGNVAKIKLNITLVDGTKEEGEFTINE